MRKRDRKEYMKAYYLTHIKECKERSKTQYLEHPEQMKARRRAYYLANSELIKTRNKAWRLAHPDYMKEYCLTHTEQMKASYKTWVLTHPMQAKARATAYLQTQKGKEAIARWNAIRKQFSFIPLNKWFYGSCAHHIDKERIIYIPKELHRSIKHNVLKDRNMQAINREAFDYMAQNYATI